MKLECWDIKFCVSYVVSSFTAKKKMEQSEVESLVMLELWEVQSTPSLPSLPSPYCPGVVAPEGVLSMGQIELFDI